MYQNNKPAFFYEICNLWQTQNMAQKNFQCFFVFSNDKADTYFKVPSLSFKIKTKSDFDNTEVKLFASYDVLPDLIETMEDYLSSKQNKMIQLAGHGYTFFLSKYPAADGIEYTTLKLSDSDSNSNDFVLRTSGLRFITRTLRYTCDNIIKLSLDFIVVAQNNSIMENLSLLNESIKRMSVSMSSGIITTVENAVVPPAPIMSEPITAEEIITKVEDSFFPKVEKKLEEPFFPKIEKKEEVVKDTPKVDDMFSGLSETVQSNPADTLTIEEKKPTDIQNRFNSFIKTEVSKPSDVKLKEGILKIIEQAHKKEFSTFEMLERILSENQMITSADMDLDKLCNYMSLSFASFTRYFKKLSMVTELHKVVTTNVPLFIMQCRFDQLYQKQSSLLNEILINLYLEYKSKENKNDLEEFTFACLRYVLAPLWTTYISINSSYLTHENEFLKKIKVMTSVCLKDWKDNFESNLDNFIYNNKLAIDYKSDTVEKLFHMYCPTIYECFKSPDSITVENVSGVRAIIENLKSTFAYEKTYVPNNFDPGTLTNNFLFAFKTFSKVNDINNETKESDVVQKYMKVTTDTKPENIISEIKALQAFDSHDGELKKNEEIQP